jgi:hypothetical protein
MRYVFGCVSAIVVFTMPLSDASAGWGCGYRWRGLPSGQHGSVWGLSSLKEARQSAFSLCSKSTAVDKCYIVACRENIDTKEQAQAIWPLGTTGHGACFGSGCD